MNLVKCSSCSTLAAPGIFRVTVHVHWEVWVTQLSFVWLIIGNHYILMLFRSHTPPPLCCHFINKTLMTQCHEKPRMLMLSPELKMVWIVNLFKSSQVFFLLIILVKIQFHFDHFLYYSHVIFSYGHLSFAEPVHILECLEKYLPTHRLFCISLLFVVISKSHSNSKKMFALQVVLATFHCSVSRSIIGLAGPITVLCV